MKHGVIVEMKQQGPIPLEPEDMSFERGNGTLCSTEATEDGGPL